MRCVVPKPYQQPHPPMFQPFSVSETTIRYTAQSGIVPWILVANPPDFQRLCHVYQEVAATGGRKLRLGENVGAFRAVHFGTTEAEAVALLRDTNYAGFQNYFGGFGFWEAFRTAEDAVKYPLDPYTPLPPSEWTVDRMRRVKYGLAGTVDQIKKEIESLRAIGGGGDLEWFGWFFDQGLMPWGGEVREIAVFDKHIIPVFRETSGELHASTRPFAGGVDMDRTLSEFGFDTDVLARHWWAIALRGAAAIIFGILAFVMPGVTLAVLVLLFGAYALVDGIFNIVAALSGRSGQRSCGWCCLEAPSGG